MSARLYLAATLCPNRSKPDSQTKALVSSVALLLAEVHGRVAAAQPSLLGRRLGSAVGGAYPSFSGMPR